MISADFASRALDGPLVAYGHTLKEVQAWLRDMVESLTNPIAALKKWGLPASGDIELELSLIFTTSKKMGELRDWIKQQAKAVKRSEKRGLKTELLPNFSNGVGTRLSHSWCHDEQ